MLKSSADRPASLHYQPSSFRMLSPGTYVVCAVTAVAIPLEELRYWSVEHQEAYVSPEVATRRLLGSH